MINVRQLSIVMTCLALGIPAIAHSQAASTPLSTSLGMIVFPAKGQAAQQQEQPVRQHAQQQQQMDLFKKGSAACL